MNLTTATWLLPLILGILSLASGISAASPEPHSIGNISVLPGGSVELGLRGSAVNLIPALPSALSNQFSQLFDLYSLEASTNLLDWTRLALLPRTIKDPQPLQFQDDSAISFPDRFYRTLARQAVCAFPKPTGPFPVGTLDRVMVDPTRTTPYRYSPATNAFMVTFYYPAARPSAGAFQAPMWDRQFARDASASSVFGFDAKWALIFPELVGQRIANAPLAEQLQRFPVILYSHGLIGGRKVQSEVAEELASHGYIVVAMDHPDCWATEFPDGRYLTGNRGGDVSGRVKDLTFLLDEMQRLNSGDSFFRGRLDLNRMGVYGMSYGGMVAETCRSDVRLKCAVFWDPTNLPTDRDGLQKPFLTALGDSNFFETENQELFRKATTHAIYLKIRNADHFTATDFAWTTLAPSARNPALAINACHVWFFATYLKGETPPFPSNPEIHDVQRK